MDYKSGKVKTGIKRDKKSQVVQVDGNFVMQGCDARDATFNSVPIGLVTAHTRFCSLPAICTGSAKGHRQGNF